MKNKHDGDHPASTASLAVLRRFAGIARLLVSMSITAIPLRHILMTIRHVHGVRCVVGVGVGVGGVGVGGCNRHNNRCRRHRRNKWRERHGKRQQHSQEPPDKFHRPNLRESTIWNRPPESYCQSTPRANLPGAIASSPLTAVARAAIHSPRTNFDSLRTRGF